MKIKKKLTRIIALVLAVAMVISVAATALAYIAS